MEINKLVYGNPTFEIMQLIQEQHYLDDIFFEHRNEDVPAPFSELAKEELNQIADYTRALQLAENKEYLDRYKSYDRNLCQTIMSAFKVKGLNVEDLCLDISNDLTPLLYKLKYHFQRPRPYQTAYHFKLKLFPFKSFSAHTPSFPSGYSTMAQVIVNVIGNKFPQHYDFCQELAEDIGISRLYLGLNYPTDKDFSEKVANAILKNSDFAKKYGI